VNGNLSKDEFPLLFYTCPSLPPTSQIGGYIKPELRNQNKRIANYEIYDISSF
jgi:hypothetical protein